MTPIKPTFLLSPATCSAGPTYPAWIQNIGQTPYIDTVAVKVEKKDGVSIRVAVLNRHPKADWTANLDILDFG